MTNTDRLYTAIRDFTNARSAHREEFLRKKRSLETYKGSAGYEKELKAARKVREDADAAARAICKKDVDSALDAMQKANSKRGMIAPTEDQVRILQVAQMLKKPTKPTLDAIANSLGGNALALAALSDIARDAWAGEEDELERFTRNYSSLATAEMTAQGAAEAIRSLGRTCAQIMNGSGANRARVLGAEHAKKFHGADYDPDDLPQEKPYMTESEFYSRELPGADFSLFAKAVND